MKNLSKILVFSKLSYNISHKLLRPSQLLKKFTEILEWSNLQRKSRSPYPTQCCSILEERQHQGHTKKLFQILANNIDNQGRWVGLRIYVRYCLKNKLKIKGDSKKHFFFCLDPLFLTFEAHQMVSWLIPSLLNDFGLQKIEVCKLMRDVMIFCYLKRKF